MMRLKYDVVSYDDVLQKRLKVMDATAIALCRDNSMDMRVLSINERGALSRMANGEPIWYLDYRKIRRRNNKQVNHVNLHRQYQYNWL